MLLSITVTVHNEKTVRKFSTTCVCLCLVQQRTSAYTFEVHKNELDYYFNLPLSYSVFNIHVECYI